MKRPTSADAAATFRVRIKSHTKSARIILDTLRSPARPDFQERARIPRLASPTWTHQSKPIVLHHPPLSSEDELATVPRRRTVPRLSGF
jgi:hypothetical protein